MSTANFADTSLEAVESWKAAHEAAMAVYDIDHVVGLVKAVYDYLLEANTTWDGGRLTTESMGRLARLHQRWYRSAGEILAIAAEIESGGYVLDNAAGLRRAYDDAGDFQAAIPGILESVEDSKAGRIVPLEDLRDVLLSGPDVPS